MQFKYVHLTDYNKSNRCLYKTVIRSAIDIFSLSSSTPCENSFHCSPTVNCNTLVICSNDGKSEQLRCVDENLTSTQTCLLSIRIKIMLYDIFNSPLSILGKVPSNTYSICSHFHLLCNLSFSNSLREAKNLSK